MEPGQNRSEGGRPPTESSSQEAKSLGADEQAGDPSKKESQGNDPPIPSTDIAPIQSPPTENKTADATASVAEQSVDLNKEKVEQDPKSNNPEASQSEKGEDKAASVVAADVQTKAAVVDNESKKEVSSATANAPESTTNTSMTIDKAEESSEKSVTGTNTAQPEQTVSPDAGLKAVEKPVVDTTKSTPSEVKDGLSQTINVSNETVLEKKPSDVPTTSEDVEMTDAPSDKAASESLLNTEKEAPTGGANVTKVLADVEMKDVETKKVEKDPASGEVPKAAPSSNEQEHSPSQTTVGTDPTESKVTESMPIHEAIQIKEEPPDEAYDIFRSASKKKRKKSSKARKAKLKISIQRNTNAEALSDLKADEVCSFPKDNLLSRDWWGDGHVDETWLDFYAEPHSDQDPSLVAREKQRDKENLDQQLKAVDERDIRARKEIDNVITDLLKEKQATMERGIEQYRERIRMESKKLLARLEQRYHERVNSNNAKITAKMKQLHQQHQNEMAQLLNGHRQQVAQRRMPDHIAQSEWQNMSRQLQQKHQQQTIKLTQNTDEYKRRTDVDYKTEQAKIQTMHDKKMTEVNLKRSTIMAELRKQFGATRQRYLKRHLQRMLKEKEVLKKEFHDKTQEDDDDTSDFGSRGLLIPTGARKQSQVQQPQHLSSPRDLAKIAVEHKQELRPPSPIRSIPKWYFEDHKNDSPKQQQSLALPYSSDDHHRYPETSVGASTRYKHRKGVLSQHSQHSQLSVEIHNEGLWIVRQPIKSKTSTGDAAGKKDDATQPEFLEWNYRANEFLDSVVNGEIPIGPLNHGRRLDFPDDSFMSQTSGQVFCSITDLRTSDETAHQQRAAALKEQEAASMAELEQKATEYARQAVEHEKLFIKEDKDEKQFALRVEQTAKEVEKAKSLKVQFHKRYIRYFGPDGRILASLDDKTRRDVETKIMKYDNNIRATMEKDKAMRGRHSDSKSKVQKFQLAFKAAQRNAQIAALVVKKRRAALAASSSSHSKKGAGKGASERPLPRVKDVMGALERLADKRREAHNTKKSGQITSTWLQTHPKLPDTLKKSVWRRMHRRKLQVVLRPSMDFLCDEVRQRAAKSVTESTDEGVQYKSSEEKQALIEEKMIRAEQLFLLSCHPEVDPSAVNVPTSRSTDAWAEPGWQLDLSVPRSTGGKSNILPRAQVFPVLERNLSEICSVPGRQAASFLHPSHFRPLASPLSTFAIMSSPAEIPSVLDRMPNPKDQEGDPLFMTDAELKAAYAYTPKPTVTPSRASAQSRSRKTKDDNETSSTSSKPTAARRTSSAAGSESKKRRSSKTEASPKKRTKQDTAATASNKPADSSKVPARQTPSKPTTTSVQASYPQMGQTKGAVANPLLAQAAHQSRPNPSNANSQQQVRQQQQSSPQRQQTQGRGKPSQMQAQQPIRPSNATQQNYAPPHQQQMAQLRMMQQGRPGQAAYQPPPPGGMQQMQQFYNPMNHPNGQYRPGMSPAPMGRMQPGAGRGVPMHPMPGTGGMPGARPMQPAAPMGAMPAPPGTQQRGVAPNTSSNPRPMQTMAKPTQQKQTATSVSAPPAGQQPQQQQQQKQQQNDQSQKDQSDPLFMLK